MQQNRTVYYAHSKLIYGSKREKNELAYLKRAYMHVVSPVTDIGDCHGKGISPFLKAVAKCDLLVCSEYKGFVGRGVCEEVVEALSKGMSVFVLKKRWGFHLIRVVDYRVEDPTDWEVHYAKLVLKYIE